MEERPFVDTGRMAPVQVLHNVPSGLKADQARAGRYRKRLMRCSACIEASGGVALYGRRHSRAAAGGDQADAYASQRIPRQSPHFRVNRAQDPVVCIQPDLDYAFVLEPVTACVPGMKKQFVGDAALLETQTPNQKDECRRGFRLDTAS
jgi:hypothetical protein